jgi:hypothetical protein
MADSRWTPQTEDGDVPEVEQPAAGVLNADEADD